MATRTHGDNMGRDEMARALALVPSEASCPRIHDRLADGSEAHAGWVDEAPRLLLAGVDSLNFSFDVEVSEETYLALMGEQLQARLAQKERNAAYCSPWLDARVLPSGAKGYGVLIETLGWTIKVQRGNPTRPPLYVEMRAIELHTHPQGVPGACAAACAFIREKLLADQPGRVRAKASYGKERLSRIDFHLDWQGGWHPTFTEGEKRQFIKPGHAKMNGHLEGMDCTGYDVGKRRIMARIYDKTVQAKREHLDWYFTLLEQLAGSGSGGGYVADDPEQHVWRLEFELKREGVTGFRLQSRPEASDPDDEIDAELEGEDLPTIGTIEKALHWAGQLWRYLTTRWLRLVAPGEDSNRARWTTHPHWQVFQEGFAAVALRGTPAPDDAERSGKLQLVRAHRHSGYSRIMRRMGLGIAETAVTLLHSDPAAVLPAYLENVRRIAKRAAALQAEKQAKGRARASDEAQQRYNEYIELLAEMALGVFAAEGVVKAELPRVGTVADLLCELVDELESIADAKGGIGQLLYDKWCKLYKTVPPRGLFSFENKMAA